MLSNAMIFLDELEGGLASIKGDRGGITYRGISSGQYPELKDRIAAGDLTDRQVETIYAKDYYYVIDGIDWLEIYAPDLAWLLFIGSVHGSGDNHLVEVIQHGLSKVGYPVKVDGIWGLRTSNALQRSWMEHSGYIRDKIDNAVDRLAQRRSISVGISGKDDAIATRVRREHAIAKRYREGVVGDEIRVSSAGVDNEWTSVKVKGFEIRVRSI